MFFGVPPIKLTILSNAAPRRAEHAHSASAAQRPADAFAARKTLHEKSRVLNINYVSRPCTKGAYSY